MKILSCHVENFGKIHDYTIDFYDGENIVCEDNGWGKSTFSAFIRAMFYGLEGDRKRSLEGNERKRYKPWQGGIFGGQIVFEIEGRAYKITRIFKDKEGNDEFELRDMRTNLLSKDYTERIGEEIFKINRESFMRTVFIGQSQCATSSTDDINAKIGRLADNSNDLNSFESANVRLTEIINKLNPHRISGSISKRREEIARYERIVRNGREISDSISIYQKYLYEEEASYDDLKAQMKEALKKQEKVSEQQALIAKRSEWERLKRGVIRKREEKKVIRQKFPGNVPVLEDVKGKISECNTMEKLHEIAVMYKFTEEEKEELSELTEVFRNGVPSDTVIEEKTKEIVRFRNKNEEFMSEQISPGERTRFDDLKSYFAGENEDVGAIIGKWNDRNTRKAALPSKRAALVALNASMASQKPQKSKGALLFWIIGIVAVVIAVVVIGMAAMSETSIVPGIAIGVVGLGLAILGIASSRKGIETVKTVNSPELENLKQVIEEDTLFIATTDQEVADYLTAHGENFDENMVSAVLQKIMTESIEYSSLKKKIQKGENNIKITELTTLRQSINNFFNKYGIISEESKFVDNIYVLKNRAEKYIALTEKEEKFRNVVREYKWLRKSVIAFLDEYGYNTLDNFSLQFNNIKDSLDEYRNIDNALREAECELEQFEAENEAAVLEEVRIEEVLPTFEELSQKIQQLSESIDDAHNKVAAYNKKLEELQAEYDEWEENCTNLEELKKLQDIEQKKYEHIFVAKAKLGLAKEAMTAKYADPILQSFSKYYEMITGNVADAFHIDANAVVTVDELGKQRDTNALSTGYRDLIGICLRVAFVDAMYQNEEPVLIMDDPFTNLDDKKVEAGREFIKKIAEKYQIIYFTCSASRG